MKLLNELLSNPQLELMEYLMKIFPILGRKSQPELSAGVGGIGNYRYGKSLIGSIKLIYLIRLRMAKYLWRQK